MAVGDKLPDSVGPHSAPVRRSPGPQRASAAPSIPARAGAVRYLGAPGGLSHSVNTSRFLAM